MRSRAGFGRRDYLFSTYSPKSKDRNDTSTRAEVLIALTQLLFLFLEVRFRFWKCCPGPGGAACILEVLTSSRRCCAHSRCPEFCAARQTDDNAIFGTFERLVRWSRPA